MLLLWLLSLITPLLWAAGEIPAGWRQYIDQRNDAIVFKPTNPDIDITVKYYPIKLLEDMSVNAWLSNKLTNSKAPIGEWHKEPERIVRESYNRAYGSRSFRKPDGRIGSIVGIAFSADLLYVRLCVLIYNTDEANKTYIKQAFDIAKKMDDLEIADAKAQRRGLALETGSYKVDGIKKGGPIKPGRYVGSKTINGKVKTQYTINLYETGEYEFPHAKKKNSGYYSYSEGYAKLYIEEPCSNARETSDSFYCFYGTNEQTGKPVIYAYDSPAYFWLNWVGPVDRLSPSQRKEIEEQKNAKNSGYQYTTNPGDGLSPDQIETILYLYEKGKYAQGAVDEEIYLLTKDGRVMDGVPVALNMLNIEKSQSREPDRWGWWQFDGQRYRFSWISKENYVIPKGTQIKSKPIPRGTRLEGDWHQTTIYKGSDFSVSSSWGVRLSKDGRFVNYSTETVQANGSNLSKQQPHKPGSDEIGVYQFDGYSLTLKYDNGNVSHLPAFSLDDTHERIWFRGGLLKRK
jgi:hypothetical protein